MEERKTAALQARWRHEDDVRMGGIGHCRGERLVVVIERTPVDRGESAIDGPDTVGGKAHDKAPESGMNSAGKAKTDRQKTVRQGRRGSCDLSGELIREATGVHRLHE